MSVAISVANLINMEYGTISFSSITITWRATTASYDNEYGLEEDVSVGVKAAAAAAAAAVVLLAVR